MGSTAMMTRYEAWGQALRRYFLSDTPQGNAIFLSVDEDALRSAARHLPQRQDQPQTLPPPKRPKTRQVPQAGLQIELDFGAGLSGEPMDPDPVKDFQCAVQKQVCRSGERVALRSIFGRGNDGVPRSLPFLSALVLAAYRMATDDEAPQINYFLRLREVLGLQKGSGRPEGMGSGPEAEAPLWTDWNRWVQEQGYLPTAHPGPPESRTTYIQYAISQALLRKADKDDLRRLFVSKQWKADWDAETVFTRVKQESDRLNKHLRDLITRAGQRITALVDLIYEEYETWRQDPDTAPDRALAKSSATLICGLYRADDPITGNWDYYLHPEQRRKQHLQGSSVLTTDGQCELVPERPRYFQPIGPINIEDIKSGLRLPICPVSETTTAVLPTKPFWRLVPDQYYPGGGIYVSGEPPQLGGSFMILCRREELADLHLLRDNELVQWAGEPIPVSDSGDWVELHECQVTAQPEEWKYVAVRNQDLFQALRPSSRTGVSLSGGLRAPNGAGWMEGYGPSVTVSSSSALAELTVVRVSDDSVKWTTTCSTNTPCEVEWQGSGTFRVDVRVADEPAPSRVVQLVSWSDLRVAASAIAG